MFRYVAAGDSITFGDGASSQNLSYPLLLNAMFRQTYGQSTALIIARPGWTSAVLADELGDTGTPVFRFANALTIWIGGDDLLAAAVGLLKGGGIGVVKQSLAQYKADLLAIIRTVQLKGCRRPVVCTQYNPFPNSPEAATAIAALNQAMLSTASLTGAVIADTHAWFAGKEAGLIAGYRSGRLQDALSGRLPVHPNNAGHRIIADGLYPLLAYRK